MNYSIGEFSKLTGLTIHTLRYYEQENLIAPKRNSANQRRYSDNDIKWIDFIKRLKGTGMPIKEIKKYAMLRSIGEETLDERMEMLVKHKKELNKQIQVLQDHMTKLDDKISFYQNEIKRLRNK
ncbi:MerR family transcriptional regulator [Ligilactobacillus apodemi]|uniref:MerR family transcriptional regulator n=1 Tax=Ligilactobacillus apodemi TaxID=307126 RepID=UPI00046ADA67|nr:MerR family transcriptional regulator [Ligilactobacillus apodemi]MCR1900658.1 MerR family transcriptional regulator [Ligilactobacillus apodemi]